MSHIVSFEQSDRLGKDGKRLLAKVLPKPLLHDGFCHMAQTTMNLRKFIKYLNINQV
ncbi:MAG: hypothetical protein ACRCZS_25070 [Chroococcidiopsis sp.]